MLTARAGEVAIKAPSTTATMLTDTLIALIITGGVGLDSSPKMLPMRVILCLSYGSFDLSFG